MLCFGLATDSSVSKCQDWAFCNAEAFEDQVRCEQARRLWLEYLLGDWGATWELSGIVIE